MNIKSTQLGVGLMEVMVALLLLTVAILGYTALQGQAIKATNESFERSQSLVMMRAIAEKVHTNPAAVETYAETLNKPYTTATPPTNKCGLDGVVVTTACEPEEMAEAEGYNIVTKLQDYDFQIQMHPCPNTGGIGSNVSTNIMYSYCLISAWGDTTPTIGDDADTDCLTERVVDAEDVLVTAGGSYHPKSTCMLMEI